MIQQAEGSFEVTSNLLLQTLKDGSYMPADIDGDGDLDVIHNNLVADHNADFPGFGGRLGGLIMIVQNWKYLKIFHRTV